MSAGDWVYDELDLFDDGDAYVDFDSEGERSGPVDLLRALLQVDHIDSDDEVEDLFDDFLDSLPDGEAFSLGQAFKQLQRTVSDPRVASIAGTMVPVAAGLGGTLIGGPALGAVGGSLATAAMRKASPQRPSPTLAAAPGAPSAQLPAVARALAVTQQPDVMRQLLSAALRSGGLPTRSPAGNAAPVLGLLSSLFGQAAEEADQLADAEMWDDSIGSQYTGDSEFEDEVLYDALMNSIGAGSGADW